MPFLATPHRSAVCKTGLSNTQQTTQQTASYQCVGNDSNAMPFSVAVGGVIFFIALVFILERLVHKLLYHKSNY